MFILLHRASVVRDLLPFGKYSVGVPLADTLLPPGNASDVFHGAIGWSELSPACATYRLSSLVRRSSPWARSSLVTSPLTQLRHLRSYRDAAIQRSCLQSCLGPHHLHPLAGGLSCCWKPCGIPAAPGAEHPCRLRLLPCLRSGLFVCLPSASSKGAGGREGGKAPRRRRADSF